jgi:hypothetical protein
VAADGDVTFIGRYARKDVSELTFADDESGIPYSALQNEYGDELLFNRIFVSGDVGSVTLEDTTSISSFGLSVLTVPDLLNQFTFELDSIASYLLNLYGEPAVRFTGLQVELAGLSSANKAAVLGLDLADQVSVKRSFSVGAPSSVTQKVIVTGIRHSIRPGSHTINFTFEPSPYEDLFTLNSLTFGILNANVLG